MARATKTQLPKLPLKQTNAAATYQQLTTHRARFISEAVQCASYTIPSLFQKTADSQELPPTPYQGVGARGVNNLAAKMMLALFPVNTPIFRLKIEPEVLAAAGGDEKVRGKVEAGLSGIENRVTSEMATRGIQHTAYELLRNLIVTGNGLLYMPPGEPFKFYSLHDYVVRRDYFGRCIELVVREKVPRGSLPSVVQAALPSATHGEDKQEELYTHVRKSDGKWTAYQEVGGMEVPDTRGTYPADSSPWLPLRFIKRRGWDYGGSYVSEYIGDLVSLDGLSQAILEGSAAMARILFLVNPAGTTDVNALTKAPNGGFVSGLPSDINTLRVDKAGDFRVALEQANSIQERLSYAFLLNSAVQRGGERVTAEEIRYVARELEDSLGGIYSLLSQELQLPMVSRLMYELEKAGKLPTLPSDAVRPQVLTGSEAVGRGNDLQKLELAMTKASLVGDQFAHRINAGEFILRVFTACGVPTDGLLKTDEEVQQEAQQQQAMAMMAQGMNPAIQAGGQIIKEGMKQ